MTERGVTRRLAAILAADIAGYTRLMGLDEAGTHARLQALHAEIVDPAVAAHYGRVFKTTGDGFLVEFPSAVDAVRCALALQKAVNDADPGAPPDRRLALRIGVNLGDVIVEGGDVFGDGVNLAARLEGFAGPGQVCLSADVWRQVRGKAEAAFDDLGDQLFKNVAEPVRVFLARPAGAPEAPTAAPATAEPARSAASRPSVAVLPFDNMSGDADQAYFADGITEDIITELSRFPDLFVIARNSTFAYKGKATSVMEVARDLGVQYVVEGSVRKAGNRVRVTAQLIDAATEAHLWANRFDRELADIFDLQDEIARTVAAAVSRRAEAAYAQRVFHKPPENMVAYEFVLAAKILHHRATREDNEEAQRLIERAIAADPDFAVAHAWKCCILGQAWSLGFGAFAELYPIAKGELRKALALDPNDLEANRVVCEDHIAHGRLEDARRYNDRAYALNPNDPRIVAQRGELLTWLGRPDEGAEWVRAAMALDPFDTHTRAHLLGRALYAEERFRDAANAYAAHPELRWPRRAELAAALAMAGDGDAARAHADEVLRANQSFSAQGYAASLPYARETDRQRLSDGLIAAGLPA